jgi:hypothetical protein
MGWKSKQDRMDELLAEAFYGEDIEVTTDSLFDDVLPTEEQEAEKKAGENAA